MTTIEISVSELIVIIDTLIGSGYLVDGGRLFKFEGKTRHELGQALLDRLGNANVGVVVAEAPK